MKALVTLEMAKNHLRIDTDDADTEIKQKIQQAGRAVRNYLKSTKPYMVELDSAGAPVLDSFGDIVYAHDSNGDVIILPEVQQAVLYLLGDMWRDRDGQEKTDWQLGFLPMPVQSLLYPLRDPALA